MNNQLITNYYVVHRDELLAFVSSRLGGSTQAEDVVHDAFLRLLSSSKMITAVTLPALVYTLLRNLIADYYRRRSVSEQYEHYIHAVCSEAFTGDSVFSAREVMEQMERGLSRLPSGCARVYRMHIYDGMKVSEISRELGEGYKSVEYRLGLARQTVRRCLMAYS